jgi:hypothetical protein
MLIELALVLRSMLWSMAHTWMSIPCKVDLQQINAMSHMLLHVIWHVPD